MRNFDDDFEGFEEEKDGFDEGYDDDDYSSCLQSENDEMRQRSNDNSEIQFEGRNISVAEYLYDSVFGSAVVNI